jgi:hypothetical protein
MTSPSSPVSYRQPLQRNALLGLLLGVTYLFLRLNEVDYGAGVHYLDPVVGFLFYLLLFWAFPLLNLVLFWRSYKRTQATARIYGVLSIAFFVGACWLSWQLLSVFARMAD